MELNTYLSILWRRKWVVLAPIAAILIVVAVGHVFVKPVYSATTTLRVAASNGGTQNPAFYNYNEQLMNTYVEMAASRPVMTELVNRLKLTVQPSVKAEVVPNTELIRVTAQASDPKLAASISNTLAQILSEQNNQFYTGGAKSSTEILAGQLDQAKADLDSARKDYERLIAQTPSATSQIAVAGQILQQKQGTYEALLLRYDQAQYMDAIQASMITVTEQAVPPQTPTQPRVALDYTLGVILGLMAGLILAFVAENMDSRLHVTREIEAAAHGPALAKLPRTSRGHLLLSANGTSPLAESVRYLAAKILWMERETPRKVLLFTGAEPGQGATVAATNLAEALAERGRKVALVDGNLRHPKLHEIFEISNEHGLTDVLSGKTDLNQALQKSPDGLFTLLPSGPVAGLPSHAVEPCQIETLLKTLRERFDYVILDTPALTVADGTSFAPYADGLILVARRSHVQRGAVESAGGFLSRFEDRYLGLVVNEAEIETDHMYA